MAKTLLTDESQSIIDELMAQGRSYVSGISPEKLVQEEITVVHLLIDCSSSMDLFSSDIVKAFNELSDALKDSKLEDRVLLGLSFFNEDHYIQSNYIPLRDTVPMTPADYRPSGMTALYDSIAESIAGLTTYCQKLDDAGMYWNAIFVVLSDGYDNRSRFNGEGEVRKLFSDLQNTEKFNLCFYAFGDDAKYVAEQIGVQPKNLMDSAQDKSLLRRKMGTISKSIISISQGSVNTFS